MELFEAILLALVKRVEAIYAALGSLKEKAPDVLLRIEALKTAATKANKYEQCREAVQLMVDVVEQVEQELVRWEAVTTRSTVASFFSRGKNNPRLILRKLNHLDSKLSNLERHLTLRLVLLVTSEVVTRTESGETIYMDMDAKQKKQGVLELLALQDPCII